MARCDVTIGHCACGACNPPLPVNLDSEANRMAYDATRGIKYDDGKPKWSLLPWDAVAEVVTVFTVKQSGSRL